MSTDIAKIADSTAETLSYCVKSFSAAMPAGITFLKSVCIGAPLVVIVNVFSSKISAMVLLPFTCASTPDIATVCPA